MIDGQAAAQAAAASATADKDAGRIVYENIIRDRATYVESTSVGDEAQILSSGFEIRSTPTAVGDLPAPVDFLATMGDMPGEIDLTWSPVYGASVYMVECREHIDPIQWKSTTVFTASKATVKNLISAKTYAFRVSAIGAAGQGPWSDESVKMVP